MNKQERSEFFGQMAVDSLTKARYLKLFIRIYNTGYHQGHHDTVDGNFTYINPLDFDSYHEDIVEQILKENEI